MLTYIDGRLRDWAMWKLGAGGRGYDLADTPCVGDSPLSYVPLNDLECAQLDACICALQPLLRQAVEEMYLRLGTTEQAAAKCRCGRMTLWRRITDAHNLILGYLNDLGAGVVVVPWEDRAHRMGIAVVALKTTCLTS